MSTDVQNVVIPGHNVNITLVINPSRITRIKPLAIKPLQVAIVKPVLILPQRPETSRRQRQSKNNVAHLTPRNLLAMVVHNPDVESRHGFTRAAGSDLWRRVTPLLRLSILAGVGDKSSSRNRRANFRRPPVVNDVGVNGAVLLQQILVHGDEGGFGPLASEEKGLEGPEAATLADAVDLLVLGILTLDGAKGRRGREHGGYFVFLDNAPEGSCIWRSDGLALVEDRRSSSKERAI